MGGREVAFRGPADALARGIHLAHQELMPFPDLTVAENLWAGREPLRVRWGWVDRAAMQRRSLELLGRVGVRVDPTMRMGDLTVGQMQGVEIARALAHEVKVLILDEPTSSLSWRETERLFQLVAELRARGVGLVYISHKLDEVFRLADRVTVLRDGERIATELCSETTPDRLMEQMVGRSVTLGRGEAGKPPGEVLLEVEQLTRTGAFAQIDLRVHRGEIVGLAGLVGAGRTDLACTLYGLFPSASGRIRLRGATFRPRHPAEALAAGVAMVAEDRQVSGLIGALSVKENLSLSILSRWGRIGWIDPSAELELAWEWANRLQIKVADLEQRIGELSGGNQQKVLLARALMTEPELLILDEPTRGIDVGAKAEIYALVRALREQGLGILLVSSEFNELMALCDRIVVMCNGRVTGEVQGAEASEALLLTYAMPRGKSVGEEGTSVGRAAAEAEKHGGSR